MIRKLLAIFGIETEWIDEKVYEGRLTYSLYGLATNTEGGYVIYQKGKYTGKERAYFVNEKMRKDLPADFVKYKLREYDEMS